MVPGSTMRWIMEPLTKIGLDEECTSVSPWASISVSGLSRMIPPHKWDNFLSAFVVTVEDPLHDHQEWFNFNSPLLIPRESQHITESGKKASSWEASCQRQFGYSHSIQGLSCSLISSKANVLFVHEEWQSLLSTLFYCLLHCLEAAEKRAGELIITP